MAYAKQTWKDRVVQFARQFTERNENGASGKNLLGGAIGANKVVQAINNPGSAYLSTVDGRKALVLVGSSAIVKTHLTSFLPNTRYTFKVDAKRGSSTLHGGYFIINYTDSTSTLVRPNLTTWETLVVVSSAGKSIASLVTTYSNAGVETYFDYDTMQFEIGAVASPFEQMKVVTLEAEPGTVTEAGSPVNAARMNYIEQGIFDAHDALGGLKFFKDIADLGLTVGTETMETICLAMPDYSKLIFWKVTGNASTDYPATSGLLTVTRYKTSRVQLEFIQGLNDGKIKKWGAYYDVNVTPKFTGWTIMTLDDDLRRLRMGAM